MLANNLISQGETIVPSDFPTAFTIGRKVGILLLLQLFAALTMPFILAKSIIVGSPAFLTAAAADSFQIRAAMLLSFVGAGLTVYLGITMFQLLRHYSTSAALLLLVVCAISCTLDVVQAGTMMSMLAMSNEFVNSGATDSELYKVVGAAVSSARRSSHATQLLAIGAWMFTFYISLFRFKLIPRALATLGLLGVASQFIGVTLMMFLGYRLISEMAMPLLPIQIIVAVWLIIKGFKDFTSKVPGESNLG